MKEKESNLTTILHDIQKVLVVPKSRHNVFSDFMFRNAEDILDAIKKLLPDGAIITTTDKVIQLGDRFYVRTVAEIKYKGEVKRCQGWAREPETQPKFNESQVTGSASSYACKRALGGLFAIDDGNDVDSQKPPQGNVLDGEARDDAKMMFLKQIHEKMDKVTSLQELETIFTEREKHYWKNKLAKDDARALKELNVRYNNLIKTFKEMEHDEL